MPDGTIVLGVLLSFGSQDAEQLQLMVALSESATVALEWAGTRQVSDTAQPIHVFSSLSAPNAPTEYRLEVAGEPARSFAIRPRQKGRLRFGVYGDNRDGEGPHRALLDQMAAAELDFLIHTGDVVPTGDDPSGFVHYLSSMQRVGPALPIVAAIGNHEVIPTDPNAPGPPLFLYFFPRPIEPLRSELGLPPSVFHLVIDKTVFIVLDSNLSYAEGSPQLRYLTAVLDRTPADLRVVAMHHGPLSSGPHGPSPDGPALLAALAGRGPSLVFAGHDHLYERLQYGDTTVIVAGGGGAPLYPIDRVLPESQSSSSTYHWVRVDVDESGVALSTFSMEGVLLDQTRLPEARAGREGDKAETHAKERVFFGLALMLGGLFFALVRIVRRPI